MSNREKEPPRPEGLPGAELPGADLPGAGLSDADLTGGDFGSVDEWSQFVGNDAASQMLMGLGNLGDSQELIEQLTAAILPASGRAAKGTANLADEKYRLVVENLPCVVFVAAIAGGENETYINPYIEELLGYGREEWMRDPFLWYWRLHPDDRERWNQEFARGLSTNGPWQADCRFLDANGKSVWVRGHAKLILDDKGRPEFLQGVAFDINSIKEQSGENSAEVQLLDSIVNAVADDGALLAVQADGCIAYLNAGSRNLLGIPETMDAGTPLERALEGLDPDTRLAVLEVVRRCRTETILPDLAVGVSVASNPPRNLRLWGRPLRGIPGGDGSLLWISRARRASS